MSDELKPYKIVASMFKGTDVNGHFVYELTFNQSLVHTARFKGIEDGLNAYREKEISDEENEILERAEEIKNKYSKNYD